MGKKRPSALDHALTDRELGRLNTFLAGRPGGCGGIEYLDGLLAAAIAGPDLVVPSEILPIALGELNDADDSPFKTLAEGQTLLGLIMRHWNSVAHGLLQGDFNPVLTLYDGKHRGTDWAIGFMEGVGLRQKLWGKLFKNRRHFDLLHPMMMLSSEEHPDPRIRVPPIDDQTRDGLLDQLGPNTVGIREFFMPGGSRARPARPRPAAQPAQAPMPLPVPHWEVGWAPIPATIESEPDTRLVAALVVSHEGQILRLTPEATPPADPQALARVLAREVEAAIADHGVPQEIWLFDQPSVTALRRVESLRHAILEVRESLPVFNAVRADLFASLGGQGGGPAVASPQTWAGWGLDPMLVAGLFKAAARLYRSAPWHLYTDRDPLDVVWPSGANWLVLVMGAGGLEHGVVCFVEPDDLAAFEDGTVATEGIQGLMVSLTFSPQEDLPPAMRKEIMREGWEVAAPDAFPMTIVANAATAGLAPEVAEQLRQLVEVVARYGETKTRRRGRSWRDRETGIVVQRF